MSSKPKYSLVKALQEDVIPEVDEAAVNAPKAKSQNLALALIPDGDGGRRAVLYRLNGSGPEALGTITLKSNPAGGSHSSPALTNKVQVKASAAEKGYGPFMYDVALGMAYPKFVMADRNSVSFEAARVWAHYLNSRPDVERVFLPDLHSQIEKDPRLKLRSYMTMPEDFPFANEVLDMENNIKDLTGWDRGSADELSQAQELDDRYRLRVKTNSVAWAFRMPAPATAKEGPALATLLANHKKNLQKNPKLIDLLKIASYDLFDEKYW